MIFGNIYWLYAFIPVFFILLLGFRYSQKKRKMFFESLIAPNLQESLISTYSARRYLLKSVLFLFSIFFFFIALAQPRWGYTLHEQKSKGTDILFALDVSKSMLAEDVKPNRLEKAKFSILDFIKKLDGSRFGLIAFAGTAFLQCPLTLDYSAFRESLEQADPSIIYRGGTDIGLAIRTAEPVFAKEDNFKILILITDGEDLEESGIAAANAAAKENIKIYTVGVGTIQGELIPVKDKNDGHDYLRDSEGKIVKTKLDESTLRKIAEETGGFYVPLGQRGEGLDQIYYAVLKDIPKQDLSSNMKQVPIERFQWPLGIGFLLLCIETILSTRKKVSGRNLKILSTKFSLLVIGLFILGISSVRLDAGLSDAYRAYQKGQFEKASMGYEKEHLKDPENPTINYNLGNSLYKEGKYSSAINALNYAIKTQDLELQQKAFYNLGNTYFRSGEQALSSNPKQATELWEDAIKHYENAVELNPQDTDSLENLDYVKKKLEELKQQQQNQQNSQDKSDEEKQKEQESDPKDKKDKNSSEGESKNDSNMSNGENKDNNNKEDEQSSDKKKNDSKSPNEDSDKTKTNNNKASDGNNSESTEKDQEPGNQSHHRMNKEEAGELLKSIENSEKRLPMIDGKQEEIYNHSKNFKDW